MAMAALRREGRRIAAPIISPRPLNPLRSSIVPTEYDAIPLLFDLCVVDDDDDNDVCARARVLFVIIVSFQFRCRLLGSVLFITAWTNIG